jgi:superfamily II DNA or RNA helicase
MIAVGSKVKLSSGDKGIVIEVREGFIKVLTEKGVLWYPINEVEEELDLIDKFLRGNFDDGIDFILSVDAHRLLLEYKFNPYVLASSTKIMIFPHQIYEVAHILDRPRMMIADEVGLGKTITAALVVSELKARGLARKILFVVPKALVLKWKYELEQRFEIKVDILDYNYIKFNPEPFKGEEFCYVSSMDFLKQDHVIKLLDNASFDILVVDEAHKFALGTERYKLGEYLATRTNYMLFLTATPHNGDDEDYLMRMNLLDPYIVDVKFTSHVLVRNMKEDVIDLDGKEVFPPRSSKTCQIGLSNEELLIHRMVDEYIAKRLEDAKDKKEYYAVWFLGIILRKRASSSLKALRLTLERRFNKLGQPIKAEEVISRIKEAEEELDEEEYEKNEDYIIGLTVSRIEEEKNEINRLIQAIDRLNGKDTKLDYLIDFIKKIKESEPKAKIIVFSEYRDTVNYLAENLSKNYKIERIDGLMSIYERQNALEKFRDPEGAEIMVCTDAAGEGIDMQFANIEINYDIPWNPNRLEQRMGRIHRIGQTRPVYYYNFVLPETLDGYILTRVFNKIETIKEALGDKVYDVIGKLLREEDIADLYNELLKAPKETWEAKLKKLDGIIEEKKRILQIINSLLTGYRLDRTKLEEIRKVRLQAVDKTEIKRFIEIYLNHKGGKIEPISYEDELYRIFLPRPIAYKTDKAIFTGSFSSEVAQQKNYTYLALGNPQVMEMIKDAIKPCVSIFTHPMRGGFLFLYKLTVIDNKKQERDGKLIALLYDEGKITAVEPRFVWDLETIHNYEPKITTSELLDAKKLVENKVYELLQELKENCDKRLSEIKQKTREIITAYYSRKIEEYELKIKNYKLKIFESPHYAKLIESEKNKQIGLRNEMKRKLEQLEKDFETLGFYELIGLALIIKQEGADARKEVEKAGIKAVLEYERERAGNDEEKIRRIKDLSDFSGIGYDIESFDRVIEVKSFKKTGPAELTSTEWATAKKLQEYYWLYCVENALEQPKIYTICNPAEKFKNKVKKVPIIDYRYVIEDWKS